MASAPRSPPKSREQDRPSLRRPVRLGLLAVGTVGLAALLLPAIHHPHPRLIWNASVSVPLGLYRINPVPALRVGDMVAVRPSRALARFMAERRYVEANVPLLKPIAATNGSTICRVGLRVTIDGRATVSALPRDRIGRPLPTWSGCLRLKPVAEIGRLTQHRSRTRHRIEH